MLPQDIVQDTKGPIQLHRTRLNQTIIELNILHPMSVGDHPTHLDSRSALANGMLLLLVDDPHRYTILQ